jgi:hypothetical protein
MHLTRRDSADPVTIEIRSSADWMWPDWMWPEATLSDAV